MPKIQRKTTDPRSWIVIGVYEESGQIIADTATAATGEEAIAKARRGEIEDAETMDEGEREGCRYILALPKGTPLAFPEGE